MNRKQFVWVLLALAVLVVAAALLWRSEREDWAPSGAQVGQRVVPRLEASDVAKLRIVEPDRRVTLARTGEGWVVEERDGYPADVARIGELLVKLVEVKTVQTETVAPAQRARMGLAAPAPGAKDAGTQLELSDAAGKPLAQLLLGKTVQRGGGGAPTGRYVLAGEGDTVSVVGDPLAEADARAQHWIAKDGFRIEHAAAIVATDAQGRVRYALKRDAQQAAQGAGEWTFGDAQAAPDPAKVGDVVGALANLRVLDVPPPADASFTPQATVRVDTAGGPVYTIAIGEATRAELGEDVYPVRVEISGELARAADATKDPAAAAQQALAERIAREKRIAGRTVRMAKSAIDPLLREQAQLRRDAPAAAPAKPG